MSNILPLNMVYTNTNKDIVVKFSSKLVWINYILKAFCWVVKRKMAKSYNMVATAGWWLRQKYRQYLHIYS